MRRARLGPGTVSTMHEAQRALIFGTCMTIERVVSKGPMIPSDFLSAIRYAEHPCGTLTF